MACSMGDVTIPGLLFAHGAVIFAEFAQALQDGLCKIESWCWRWGMSLNVVKCGCIVGMDYKKVLVAVYLVLLCQHSSITHTPACQ